MRKLFAVLGATAIALTLSARAEAWTITVGGAGGSTLAGDNANPSVFTWTFGGVSHLFNELYYVGIGGGPGVLAGVDPDGPVLTDADGDGTVDTVGLTFNLPGQEGTLTTIHTLSVGSTPEWSTSFRFSSGNPLNFYIYADYDLGGTIGDSFVQWANDNATVQVDPLTILSWRTFTPNFTCAGFFALPGSCGSQIAAGGNLDNSTFAGPGDLVFAAQYGRQTFSVDRSLSPVPEPASMVLLGSGLLGLAARARRRK
jgi:PEP-CTERM motif